MNKCCYFRSLGSNGECTVNPPTEKSSGVHILTYPIIKPDCHCRFYAESYPVIKPVEMTARQKALLKKNSAN